LWATQFAAFNLASVVRLMKARSIIVVVVNLKS
jgi:hypothetical protein